MRTQLRIFAKKADRLVGSWAARFMKKRSEFSWDYSPDQIAVIRLWAIGESLLALPAIASLHARWPKAKISVITTERLVPLFSNQPFIDDTIVIRPRVSAFLRFAFTHHQAFGMAVDFEPYLYTSAWLARLIGKVSYGFATLQRVAYLSFKNRLLALRFE